MKKRQSKLYILLFLLISILVVLQIFLSNRLSSEGKVLSLIQEQVKELENNNNQLKNKIALAGCLTNLNQTAEKKGFVSNPTIINLSDKFPVAAVSLLK